MRPTNPMNHRPCWAEISTSALENNFHALADSMPVEMLAIVKADAYGHGLSICAPAAARAGARWMGVTSVEEGVAARALCPDAEILVIGGPFPGQGAAALAHRLTAVVWETWQFDELEAGIHAGAGGSLAVHLELDTGMSRQGVAAEGLDALLQRFGSDSALRLDGLMTHLYAADESDGVATGEQLTRLETMVEQIFAAGLRPAWLHVGNSAAVLGGAVMVKLMAMCNRFGLKAMSRPGLALYGVVPEYEPRADVPLQGRLERVLAWKTRVVSVRTVAEGAIVGYNATFVATEPMRVALLAVGYADGLKRGLSNRGSVLVRGAQAPIIGRISMDQTVADVTGIEGVVAGDEVVLLGEQGAETISAEDHAQWAGTIPWEIFTSIANRVERVEI